MQTLVLLPSTALPLTILLPMRLLAYNRGMRQLYLITHSESLPAPIVSWLQESVQYRALIEGILEP